MSSGPPTQLPAGAAAEAGEAFDTALFEALPGNYVALHPKDYRVLAVSTDYLQLTGRRRDDMLGKVFFDVFPDDPANPAASGTANLRASFERVKATLQRDAMDVQRHPIRNAGTGKLEDRYWKPLNIPVVGADGQLQLIIHSTQDLTAQLQSQEALRRVHSLERIAGMTAHVGGWMVELGVERKVTWAPEIYAMYEWEDVTPPPIGAVLDLLEPASRRVFDQAREDCQHYGVPFDLEVSLHTFKGTPKWLRIVGEPERAADGSIVRMIGAVQDITRSKTEQLQSQQRIAESQARLKYVTEAALDIVWDIDLIQGTCWCNHGVARFGYDFGGQRIAMEDWLSKLHPDDRAANTPGLEQTLADPMARHWSCGYRFLTASGTWVHFEDRCYILRDAEGRPVRMVGGSTDVTKRLAMEEQLLQTQRLESLGQLTGGIAHDFNNLLTVILGNTEVLHDELQGQERLLRLTANIDRAATRSANLTRQLLAFSRKQALQPSALDVNRMLTNLKGMLARTLGEHIVIDLRPQADLWAAFVDSAQLEVALLNLCINARDAMPQGGTLTLATGNTHLDAAFSERHREVQPGDYVCISVADTGTGIAPDVLDRVFEPFFTTKEAGKGTGLGLSMVFGFVKQSNGHINIYSELGLGTTIRLYLPCSTRSEADSERSAPQHSVVGGSELILLVEDNDLVRQFGQDLLRSLGYQVLAAGDGLAALALLQRHPDIRLLFTDVVMPGMGGDELARQALQLRPELKVLYTSGYTQDAMLQHGKLAPGVHLLAKPYSKAELAAKLREVLEHRDADG